jgi:hypothetical protein
MVFFFFFFFQFSNIENSVIFFKKLAKLIEFTILKTHLFPKNSQLFCPKNNQICRKKNKNITTPTYHAF